MLTILVFCIFSLSRMRSQLVLCDKVTIIYRSMVASGWLVLGGAGGAGCVVCFCFFSFFFFFLVFRIFFPDLSYFVVRFLSFTFFFSLTLVFAPSSLPFFAKRPEEGETKIQGCWRYTYNPRGWTHCTFVDSREQSHGRSTFFGQSYRIIIASRKLRNLAKLEFWRILEMISTFIRDNEN